MAAELIREMGIPRSIIPHHPGQFSAYGFLHSNARVDRQRTLMTSSVNYRPTEAVSLMAQLVDECRDELRGQGFGPDFDVERRLDMRYQGQNYELELVVGEGLLYRDDGERLWREFHDTHKARFGFDNRGEIIEIVNFSASVSAAVDSPVLPRPAVREGPPVAGAYRDVSFGGKKSSTPIYWRDDLHPGQSIDGPAVVEEAASVTPVLSGQALEVDMFGHLVLVNGAAGEEQK